MKTGLVLEGGAMRGLFSAGILDVFMENDIVFDGAIGVSAGVAFGCSYKSGQLGRSIRYNMKYAKDKHYCSMDSLLRTGDLYNVDFCYHLLPDELDPFDKEAFYQNPMPFYAVCTDVMTGKAVYHLCDQDPETDKQYFRASASMPLAARIVEVDGKQLLDGGIADSIPLEAFEKMGYDRNVVILTQPRDYVKKPLSLPHLSHLVMRKYPRVYETMLNRHVTYMKEREYVFAKEKNQEVLVLCPQTSLGIGHICHDPDEMKRVYDLGRTEGEKHLSCIRSFLKK